MTKKKLVLLVCITLGLIFLVFVARELNVVYGMRVCACKNTPVFPVGIDGQPLEYSE